VSNGIILFDGVCNFCNRSVNFIINHDPLGYFKFAALQSAEGQDLRSNYGIWHSDLDTLILIEDGKIFTRSTAALMILRKLSGWTSILHDFIIVPEFIRDPLYDFFAKYRYKIFGRQATCRVPTKEERARFI
jgi:predicted DCC family thiol-disulfide oxidoreductase YuxK